MELQILGKQPIFPEIKPQFKYLLDILSDTNYGIKNDGLSFTELKSFCELTKIKLNRFEIVTLVNLSYAYIGMLNKAKDNECEQPYKNDELWF